MPKRVAIIKSCYIPWKGYFDIIHDVDLFLVESCVQYTPRDWRNRNKIKTPQGTLWLTVPVGHQSLKKIHDISICNGSWAERHWRNLENFYRKAPHFWRYEAFFRDVYLHRHWEKLWELNLYLIRTIASEFLGVTTEIRDTANLLPTGNKLDGLIDLLRKVKADIYVSGPSAKAYIDGNRFEEEGISLVYKDYSGYPEYPQFFPPFVHEVSIIDMLFHLGPETPDYIWRWRQGTT